eukprot:1357115-Amorphochlora_amoeboformis.AAC.1
MNSGQHNADWHDQKLWEDTAARLRQDIQQRNILVSAIQKDRQRVLEKVEVGAGEKYFLRSVDVEGGRVWCAITISFRMHESSMTRVDLEFPKTSGDFTGSGLKPDGAIVSLKGAEKEKTDAIHRLHEAEVKITALCLDVFGQQNEYKSKLDKQSKIFK